VLPRPLPLGLAMGSMFWRGVLLDGVSAAPGPQIGFHVRRGPPWDWCSLLRPLGAWMGNAAISGGHRTRDRLCTVQYSTVLKCTALYRDHSSAREAGEAKLGLPLRDAAGASDVPGGGSW